MEKTLHEQQFEALQTASEYIIKLINGVDMCISSIEISKFSDASNLLKYIIEGIEWLNEVARLTKNAQEKNMDENIMFENIQLLVDYLNSDSYEKVLKLMKEDILPLLLDWQQSIEKSIAS